MRRDDGCSGHSRGRGRRAPRADPAQRRARAGACYRRRCAACRRSRPGSDRHGVWPRRAERRRGGGSLRPEGPPGRSLGGGAGGRPPGGGVPGGGCPAGAGRADGPPLAGTAHGGAAPAGGTGPAARRRRRHRRGPLPRPPLAAPTPRGGGAARRHQRQPSRHPHTPEAAQVLAALAPAPGRRRALARAPTSPGDPQPALSEPGATIAVAVDGGPCSGEASTVVAWRNGTLEVLRPGPLRIETPRHP